MSLPGEHLFQASALPPDRMRPAIFHACGKAKIGAQKALRSLEKQGWETLPIAILGMPNLPPAWSVDDWKPVGGCKFSGYSSGIVGSSALRFCLLLRWRAIGRQPTDLFPGATQGDSLSCCPGASGDDDMESVNTPSSDNSAARERTLTRAVARALGEETTKVYNFACTDKHGARAAGGQSTAYVSFSFRVLGPSS